MRLARLAKTTGLTRREVDLLELALRYQTQPVIESMIDDVFRAPRRFMTPLNVQGPALPTLLGVSANTVQARLRADAPLVRSGIVSVDGDGDLHPLDRLNRLAAGPAGSGTDVHHLLLDAAPASELEWSGFDHVARDRDHIERVITGALASGAPGVNILLYGPPGMVKTEFCKVLAERLDASLYSVGEFDDKGDEPMRGERLQELRLAQRLLAGHGGSLLLFDEMEDLLSDPFPAWELFGPHSRMAFRNTGSKVYMHRLLEAAPTPTLWTMNSPRGVSETILRRMMFALELRRPTPGVRARIWTRELARHGVEAGSEDVLSLAREPAGGSATVFAGGGSQGWPARAMQMRRSSPRSEVSVVTEGRPAGYDRSNPGRSAPPPPVRSAAARSASCTRTQCTVESSSSPKADSNPSTRSATRSKRSQVLRERRRTSAAISAAPGTSSSSLSGLSPPSAYHLMRLSLVIRCMDRAPSQRRDARCNRSPASMRRSFQARRSSQRSGMPLRP